MQENKNLWGFMSPYLDVIFSIYGPVILVNIY